MKKNVNEKTLELNVVAELLGRVRSVPSCGSAFFSGMTQAEETRWGSDEMLKGVPAGRHLVLQFKAPDAGAAEGHPYRFGITRKQSRRLLLLANMWPNCVYFVLPCLRRFTGVATASPNLLAATVFVRVESIEPAATTWTSERHSFRVTGPTGVEVRSQPTEVQALTAGDVLEAAIGTSAESGLSDLPRTDDLREWLTTLSDDAESAQEFGAALRGVGSLLLPDSP